LTLKTSCTIKLAAEPFSVVLGRKAMIAVRNNFPQLTAEEYFDWEEQQQIRHEYLNGEVYAMTGGTINHSKVASNLNFILKSHLRGGSCQILTSDGRVKLETYNAYVYPDVSVSCDRRDRSTPKYITYPCLIAEVLSPKTEAYDRGDKFTMYRQNPVLQDYLLVSAEKIAIDIYQKNDRGGWEIINYRSGDTIKLQSIDLDFAIEQVYEDIIFEE
jgi:Uma2 family endonuclease